MFYVPLNIQFLEKAADGGRNVEVSRTLCNYEIWEKYLLNSKAMVHIEDLLPARLCLYFNIIHSQNNFR